MRYGRSIGTHNFCFRKATRYPVAPRGRTLGGTRTRTNQFRRLVLYPIKLQGHERVEQDSNLQVYRVGAGHFVQLNYRRI